MADLLDALGDVAGKVGELFRSRMEGRAEGNVGGRQVVLPVAVAVETTRGPPRRL